MRKAVRQALFQSARNFEVRLPMCSVSFRPPMQNSTMSQPKTGEEVLDTDSSALIQLDTPKGSKNPPGRPSTHHLLLREGANQNKIFTFFGSPSTTPTMKRGPQEDPPGQDEAAKKTKIDVATIRQEFKEALNSAVSDILKSFAEMKSEMHTNQNLFMSQIQQQITDCKKSLEDLKQGDEERKVEWTNYKDEINEKIEGMKSSLDSFKLEQTARFDQLNVPNHVELGDDVVARLSTELSTCRKWIAGEDRRRRKLNLIIKGLTLESRDVLKEVDEFLGQKFDAKDQIINAKLTTKPGTKTMIVVTLKSAGIRSHILRNKKAKLANSTIFIEPDLPPEDREIQAALRGEARAARNTGKKTKIVNNKIQIDNQWFFWSSEEKSLKPATRNTNSKNVVREDRV